MPKLTHKKIALVANTSWSIYNFRLGLIRRLLTAGHEVHVVAPRDGYSDKLIAEGAHYVSLPLNNYSTNPLSDLRIIGSLYNLYRRERFDHVFHYTMKPILYGSIVSKITAVKSIAVTTGLGKMFRFENRITQFIISTIYKVAARCAEQVWFLNEADRVRMVDAGIVDLSKTKILPSEGINTDKFRPSRKAKSNSFFRFLFAGRLLREKGVYNYVAAAKKLKEIYPKVKFELLGFIDERNPDSVSPTDIEQWQRDGIVNYLGSTEDVRPYIDRADCLVLPSYYQEGISRILLEAASMSTPMITSDQPGCAQVVVDGRTGIVVPEKNHQALVNAMQSMITMSDNDLRIWGELARQYTKDRYDEQIVIKSYMAVVGEEDYKKVNKNNF